MFDDCGPAGHVELYWPGYYSPWHQELRGNGYDFPTFSTEAAALEYTETAGPPYPVMVGEVQATFRWEIRMESVEHRENYSMGGGNFLKRGGKNNSGWSVSSIPLEWMGKDGTAPYEIGGEIARTWSAM